jgi:hypothetical protein
MDSFRIIDGKKWMWDGEDYESESAAQESIAKYSDDGFDTKLLEEEGKYVVMTRRLVKEIQVEGDAM